MRSGLRARAHFSENPGDVPAAEHYASACVFLLSVAGKAERGSVLQVAA
jgi:hypothetical protein